MFVFKNKGTGFVVVERYPSVWMEVLKYVSISPCLPLPFALTMVLLLLLLLPVSMGKRARKLPRLKPLGFIALSIC